MGELRLVTDQSWGARRFVGAGDDGASIDVTAHGGDAVGSRMATALWRLLWYRGTGPPESLTRMQAVEHEAMMTLWAGRAGVPTVEPIAACRAGEDLAILAVRREGTALSRLEPHLVSDENLVAIWCDVARLHRARIAHGNLTTDVVMIDESGHLFGEFSHGSIASDDLMRADVVTLLFTMGDQFGIDRTVRTAAVGLGRDGLGAALPYLQLPALRGVTRRVVADSKQLMTKLRRCVLDQTGFDAPEPVRLRRVSVRNVLTLLMILVAANALMSQLAGIDFAVVWDVVQQAAWLTLAFAIPVAHLSFVAEAGAMMASVGRPLPFRPLVLLQVAARFIGLAVPTAAGRVAMNSAFLFKHGVSRATAVVQGAVDGLSGFIVEVGILIVAVIGSGLDLDLVGDVDWLRILFAAVVLAVASVVGLFLSKRARAAILPVLRDGFRAVSSVLKDPRRALRLVWNNLLSRVALGFALLMILRALGVADIGVGTALVVTVATNLLAGIVPVPGGVGVAEAVMMSLLVAVGMPEPEAFAATVMYRLWSFYLPALEGFFAVRWLERRDYL